ncbi:uncharacterized protein LOC141690901 [Apium graveolens]|uniref:uncharacterized protein LOC141690901 n=1 Tax=Apium graveolens TaxID=4045 RepID=UPI003D7B950A
MTPLCTQDFYWHQKTDAIGLLGLLPQQKITAALRMLAYVEGLFGEEYLRAPTPTYLRRLLARGEQRGFPGNSPTVVFHVNGKRYNNAYYLADGIYPRYSTFVKTISNPATQSHKLFAKKQEAYRKDVERCFGILQSRWAILRHGARMHKRSTLRSIMMTCIILHNMIVEDEFVEEEFVEPVEEDLMNPLASQVYDGPVDCNGVRIPFAPVQRNGTNQQAFWDRIENLESAYIHTIKVLLALLLFVSPVLASPSTFKGFLRLF